MPFTLSHVVLAPPLSRLTGGRLPTAALAIGCMVPDLFRLFTVERSNVTHFWSALIHPDLWIGLIFCAAWYLLYRPAVYRFLGLQHDLDIYSAWAALRFLGAVCAAIIAGTATHLIWDGLTHLDFRTFAFHDFLGQTVTLFGLSFPMHQVLQIGTSAAALPLLFWMCAQYYQQVRQVQRVSPSIKVYAWSLLGLTLLMGSYSVWDYARYFSQELWMSNLYYFTARSINEFTQAALPCFSLGCILFLFLDYRDYFRTIPD